MVSALGTRFVNPRWVCFSVVRALAILDPSRFIMFYYVLGAKGLRIHVNSGPRLDPANHTPRFANASSTLRTASSNFEFDQSLVNLRAHSEGRFLPKGSTQHRSEIQYFRPFSMFAPIALCHVHHIVVTISIAVRLHASFVHTSKWAVRFSRNSGSLS